MMASADPASGAGERLIDPHDGGERRYLSVMFCDLVDSTPLSGRLDPEDLRDFVHLYHHIAETSITRYAGRISQYLGDGVLAYFGYPSAHEDDARRAILAGLDITSRIAGLENQQIAARIAIHTGPVLIGNVDWPDGGKAELVGLAVNVAARLQNVAAPNSVIISAATAALVTGYFDLIPLGPLSLKGVDEPVVVYRPRASHPEFTRFDVSAARGLTPFVGRENDLTYLEQRWHALTRGHSTTTLLIGEPGIGKTRLLQEFRLLHDTECDRVQLHCSDLDGNAQLYPVVRHLKSLLGASEEVKAAAASVQADALPALLDRFGLPQEPALSLISILLELPIPNETELPEGIELRRELLIQTLRHLLIGGESDRPLLMLIEDLQWADPTTLELLRSLPGLEPVRPVMIVCTARPGFSFPWRERGDIDRHELRHLDERSARDMVAWLTRRIKGGLLSEELMTTIIERSDGVPLFLEEIAALVGSNDDEGGETPVAAVPTSLLNLLISRVDQLGEAKGLIQAAALIGREFSADLLAAIRDEDRGATQATLDRADVSELVNRAGAHAGEFAFRHALLRDAAYSTLLLRQRRRLHARLGRILIDDEEQDAPKYSAAPHVIAYHCREGGLTSEATHYFHVAATRSMSIGANAEAVAFIDQAMALLDGTDTGPSRTSTALTLLATKGPALMAQFGFAHQSVAETFRKAKDLIDELGDRVELFPVLYGLCAYSAVRCDFDMASDLSARLRRSASQAEDQDLIMLAHAASAQTDFLRGRFTSAAEHAALCIAHHDPVRQANYRVLFGEDPGTICRGVACWLTWLRGDPTEAVTSMAITIDAARSLDHAFTLAQTLVIAARLHHYMADTSGLRRVVDEALDISSRHGFPLFIAEATVWSGWADAVDDSNPSGLDRLREGLDAWTSSGAEMFVPHHLTLLGEAAWRLGDGEAALTALSEARRRAVASGDLDHQVEALRLGAVVVASHLHRFGEAEELLLQAGQLAEQQGARILAVRVAVSRAELALQTGNREVFDHAVINIAALLRNLPPGATSPELDRARALTR